MKASDDGRFSSSNGSNDGYDNNKLTKTNSLHANGEKISDSYYICHNLVVQRKVFSKLDKDTEVWYLKLCGSEYCAMLAQHNVTIADVTQIGLSEPTMSLYNQKSEQSSSNKQQLISRIAWFDVSFKANDSDEQWLKSNG